MEKKSEKGITLLMLVVAIVIMVILGGISISTLIGDNGILKKAVEAKESSYLAGIEEELKLSWYDIETQAASENWDANTKASVLQKKLQENDSFAAAVIDGNDIKITYRQCETEIDIKTGTLGEIVPQPNLDITALATVSDVDPKDSLKNSNSTKTSKKQIASSTVKVDKNNLIEEIYKYNGECVFNGSNYINTNIYLYSAENLHRNFRISFNIIKVEDGNSNHSTLMSSMDESGILKSGNKVKYAGNNTKVYVTDGKQSLKLESNSNTSSTGDVNIPSNVTKVSVMRLNDKFYYSFDENDFALINDFTGFEEDFDVPVTFGAALDKNNNPMRYFKGTLSDMTIDLISDDAKIEDFNGKKNELAVVYEHKNPIYFDGEKGFINTGLCLFTSDNIDKDFEISFTIDSIESGYVNQATIINVKREISPFPGFVYRLYSSDNTIKFESKAGTGTGSSNKQSDVKDVKLSRIDRKIYLQINNGQDKEVYDFTNFTSYYSVPLTIGASLDGEGKPFRYFKGTLSNIVIKVEE